MKLSKTKLRFIFMMLAEDETCINRNSVIIVGDFFVLDFLVILGIIGIDFYMVFFFPMSTVVFEKEIQGLPEKFVDLDEFRSRLARYDEENVRFYPCEAHELSEEAKKMHDESVRKGDFISVGSLS